MTKFKSKKNDGNTLWKTVNKSTSSLRQNKQSQQAQLCLILLLKGIWLEKLKLELELPDFEIWLKSYVLKGIWLEKLKFGWTLMNNGWLWNLVELWWIMADFEIWLNSVELKGIWLENWNLVGIWLEKLKFGWNLMYWKVFDWKNWNLVLKLELELPDFEIWLNSDE